MNPHREDRDCFPRWRIERVSRGKFEASAMRGAGNPSVSNYAAIERLMGVAALTGYCMDLALMADQQQALSADADR